MQERSSDDGSEFEDLPCKQCCEKNEKTPEPNRVFRMVCGTCCCSLTMPVNLCSWTCATCGENICPECGQQIHGLRSSFCSVQCAEASRKARLIADKEARRPWKYPRPDLGGAEDVLKVEVVNALQLLQL